MDLLRKKKLNNKGFTLVEMIVGTLICSIILALTIPMFVVMSKNADASNLMKENKELAKIIFEKLEHELKYSNSVEIRERSYPDSSLTYKKLFEKKNDNKFYLRDNLLGSEYFYNRKDYDVEITPIDNRFLKVIVKSYNEKRECIYTYENSIKLINLEQQRVSIEPADPITYINPKIAVLKPEDRTPQPSLTPYVVPTLPPNYNIGNVISKGESGSSNESMFAVQDQTVEINGNSEKNDVFKYKCVYLQPPEGEKVLNKNTNSAFHVNIMTHLIYINGEVMAAANGDGNKPTNFDIETPTWVYPSGYPGDKHTIVCVPEDIMVTSHVGSALLHKGYYYTTREVANLLNYPIDQTMFTKITDLRVLLKQLDLLEVEYEFR